MRVKLTESGSRSETLNGKSWFAAVNMRIGLSHMFNLAYSEIAAGAPAETRAREREALQRSVDLMELAEVAGHRSREAIVALNFIRSLWTILIEDLAHPDNLLPPMIRAQLISIGISILRQAEDIRLEKERSFAGLIQVSRLIGEGLK